MGKGLSEEEGKEGGAEEGDFRVGRRREGATRNLFFALVGEGGREERGRDDRSIHHVPNRPNVPHSQRKDANGGRGGEESG